MLTVAIALCLLVQDASQGAVENPFAAPQNVVETDRIALTPKLDGTISSEEWDAFALSGGIQTYFQWEPDRFHAAATLPASKQLVLSIDRKGDGWLVGKDNLEVRLEWNGDRPAIHARWLDATDRRGPTWVPAPEFEASAMFSGAVTGDMWTAELTIVNPGTSYLPKGKDQRPGVRVDAADAAMEFAPFLPRATTLVETKMERGANLPGGMRWGNQLAWSTLGPGAQWKVRLTFNGSNEMELDRLAIRVIGQGSEDYAVLDSPFPRFDNKGRSFIDYASAIPRNAFQGYRNLTTTVTDKNGEAAILRLAFRVLPILYFDPVLPSGVRNTEKGVRVRLPVHVINRTPEKLSGTYSVTLPAGWEQMEGGDRNMTLRGFNSDARRVLQVTVPADAKGAYPIVFAFDMGDRKLQQTEWIWIDEPPAKQ